MSAFSKTLTVRPPPLFFNSYLSIISFEAHQSDVLVFFNSETATGKHGFEVTNLDTHKKWQFYCQNSEERQKWVQKIHDATSALLSIGSSVWGSAAARAAAGRLRTR